MEVLRYLTTSGNDVLGEWLSGLADRGARAKIAARIARLMAGNLGDCKALRAGIGELRVDWGRVLRDAGTRPDPAALRRR